MPIGTSIPAIVAPARNSIGSQASRSSRLAASAMSSRWFGATRSATAPFAGEPPISSARSLTAARPLPTVSRPSARNGTGGAGSSTARLGPRLAIVPASVPSGANWPVKLAPRPFALPCPSSVAFRPATPSEPAAVSRAVKCQSWPLNRAVPDADSAPVSSVAKVASMPVKASCPTVSRPFSIRAANAASQVGGRDRSTPDSAGQGMRRSGPCSTSSRASTCPPISGQSAMRNRSASTRIERSAAPLPPTSTFAAISSGCGSSVSEIGPLMVTGWPSVAVASTSIVAR